MKSTSTASGHISWPEQFRCQAQACLRLAEKATEHWVTASLTELAQDYLARAERAELAVARPRYARSTSTRVSL